MFLHDILSLFTRRGDSTEAQWRRGFSVGDRVALCPFKDEIGRVESFNDQRRRIRISNGRSYRPDALVNIESRFPRIFVRAQ